MNYDYAKIAKEVIQAVGGSENIKSSSEPVMSTGSMNKLFSLVLPRPLQAKRKKQKWTAKTNCKKPSGLSGMSLFPLYLP